MSVPAPGAASDPPSAASASRRARRRDGEQTRRRVLQAVIETILDVGYYRASTNEIARRAGVTWGVLQHQFGTREGLLLEVLDDSWSRLQDLVASATITGDTLEARLEQVLTVLEQHYGRPEHLVELQIGLDLVNNPTASAETRRAVLRHAARLGRAWQPICAAALGDCAGEADLARYVYDAFRGYLVSTTITASFRRPPRDDLQRRLLVQGVAASVRTEATTRGLACH